MFKQSFPELWKFKLICAISLLIIAIPFSKIINRVAAIGETAFTSANVSEFVFSWRMPALIVLGFALILWYFIVEIVAQVKMNKDIFLGKNVNVFSEIFQSLKIIKRFLNPTGIMVIFFIFAAVPLCGVGFSLSLTKTFYIPNFILDTIKSNPILFFLYLLLLFLMATFCYRSIFTIHGVVFDNLTPKDAIKNSQKIMSKYSLAFLFGIIKIFIAFFLINLVSSLLFQDFPKFLLDSFGKNIPNGKYVDFFKFFNSGLSTSEQEIVGYRIIASIIVLFGSYLKALVVLMFNAYLMLRISKYYLSFTRGEIDGYVERPKKNRYYKNVVFMVFVFIAIISYSVFTGMFFNQILIRDSNVEIIAHRSGGYLAQENSLSGIDLAYSNGCFGSEIDVQRTKDGYYIANHDNTFDRIAGINSAPYELTLSEIKSIKTNNNPSIHIPTLNEMLIASKDKVKLFIELKGKTADEQMVDDIVKIIREAGCENNCVLISLNYRIINYAETKYPNFETGVLFFAGIGNVSKLNCDWIMMEEEFYSKSKIFDIHEEGKKAAIWTVNSDASLKKFLSSPVDAIITDDILKAKETIKKLSSRTEFEILQDQLSDFRFW